MKQKSPSQNAIAVRAYLLWEQAGRPVGRDKEFWSRAETELAVNADATSVPPVMAPPVMTPPPTSAAAPAHQVPPRIKDAVKTPGRRPPVRRAPKRL